MSGTSLDDINTVVANIQNNQFTLLATHHEPYPAELRARLRKLIETQETSLQNLGTLDHQLALSYAGSVHTLLKKTRLTPSDINAIGCHGQTICHHPHPPYPFTIQLGDPNLLAARTGIPVVFDFRRLDMALGGQGAPLAPLFHQAVLSKQGVRRAIINLGGIANVSLLDGHRIVSGFDVGPANALLDAWILKHQHLAYDAEGAWARSGHTDVDLLRRFLQDPYFHRPPPKSTGKEYFNLRWIEQHGADSLVPSNVQATLTELTAETLVRAWPLSNFAPEELYLCGGGALNTYLRERIAALSKLPTHTTEALGVYPTWVEAALMAWLCAQHCEKKSLALQCITGSQKSFIPGCYQKNIFA